MFGLPRRLFFDHRPALLEPTLNSHFITLASTPFGLLETPTAGAQNRTPVGRVVPDPKFRFNHPSHAIARPDFPSKARRFGVFANNLKQLGLLELAQARLGARGWSALQGLRATLGPLA